jgi:hypothetical protein
MVTVIGELMAIELGDAVAIVAVSGLITPGDMVFPVTTGGA